MVDKAVQQLARRGIMIERKSYGLWSGKDSDISALGFTKGNEISYTCPLRGSDGFCAMPLTYMVVLWDGRVVCCCHDYDGFEVLGDVNRQKLMDIWNGPNMQKFREDVTSGAGRNRLCCKCPCVKRLLYNLKPLRKKLLHLASVVVPVRSWRHKIREL